MVNCPVIGAVRIHYEHPSIVARVDSMLATRTRTSTSGHRTTTISSSTTDHRHPSTNLFVIELLFFVTMYSVCQPKTCNVKMEFLQQNSCCYETLTASDMRQCISGLVDRWQLQRSTRRPRSELSNCSTRQPSDVLCCVTINCHRRPLSDINWSVENKLFTVPVVHYDDLTYCSSLSSSTGAKPEIRRRGATCRHMMAVRPAHHAGQQLHSAMATATATVGL